MRDAFLFYKILILTNLLSLFSFVQQSKICFFNSVLMNFCLLLQNTDQYVETMFAICNVYLLSCKLPFISRHIFLHISLFARAPLPLQRTCLFNRFTTRCVARIPIVKIALESLRLCFINGAEIIPRTRAPAGER